MAARVANGRGRGLGAAAAATRLGLGLRWWLVGAGATTRLTGGSSRAKRLELVFDRERRGASKRLELPRRRGDELIPSAARPKLDSDR